MSGCSGTSTPRVLWGHRVDLVPSEPVFAEGLDQWCFPWPSCSANASAHPQGAQSIRLRHYTLCIRRLYAMLGHMLNRRSSVLS